MLFFKKSLSFFLIFVSFLYFIFYRQCDQRAYRNIHILSFKKNFCTWFISHFLFMKNIRNLQIIVLNFAIALVTLIFKMQHSAKHIAATHTRAHSNSGTPLACTNAKSISAYPLCPATPLALVLAFASFSFVSLTFPARLLVFFLFLRKLDLWLSLSLWHIKCILFL